MAETNSNDVIIREGDLVTLKEEYLRVGEDPMELFEVFVSFEDMKRCLIAPHNPRSERPQELVSWDMITLKVPKELAEKLN